MSVADPTGSLDIAIEDYELQSARSKLISLLSPADRPRVRSINVTSAGRTAARDLIAAIGPSPLPRLVSLTLDLDNEEDEEEFRYAFEEEVDPDDLLVEVAALSFQAPLLNAAVLHNVCLPWNVALFSQFVSLKIDVDGKLASIYRPTHDILCDVLAGMHILEHLFLGDTFPEYPRRLPSNLRRIIIPNTCRSITLRVDHDYGDFMHLARYLQVPPASRLNFIITNHTDCAGILRHFTSGPLALRGARIIGYDGVQSDCGCGAISLIRDATAWLEAPQTALLDTPTPHIHFRFLAVPTGLIEDEECNYDHHFDRYASGLRAIDLSQLQVLHLPDFPGRLSEELIAGDEQYHTYHPILQSAEHLKVLILSGYSTCNLWVFYDILAGQNTTGNFLLPQLRILFVAFPPSARPQGGNSGDDSEDGLEDGPFDKASRDALKRLLRRRRSAGFPLHTLTMHRGFQGHALLEEIGNLVQVEFFDTAESAHADVVEWEWQAWPPTT
ncbi:hypothetical protein PENSPDRAFT_757614 [Peniophora sp. CONT]|nr:hypothetical protein PENSPDRAFT_757614 [Peniophora sp. CONT]